MEKTKLSKKPIRYPKENEDKNLSKDKKKKKGISKGKIKAKTNNKLNNIETDIIKNVDKDTESKNIESKDYSKEILNNKEDLLYKEEIDIFLNAFNTFPIEEEGIINDLNYIIENNPNLEVEEIENKKEKETYENVVCLQVDQKKENSSSNSYNIYNNTDKNLLIEKNYFSLGIDKKKENNNNILNLCTGFINNKLVQVIKDTLFYEGFEFIKIKRYYKPKNVINSIIFRCKNYRKNEHIRTGKGRFCDAKIELVIKTENKLNEQQFYLKHEHSLECRQEKIIYPFNKEIINEWDDFTNLCYNYLNKTDDFNFKKSLEACKKIYDDNKDTKYNFIYDEKNF